MPKDYYVVLGVPPGEDSERVREAFRELAKEHHPDQAGPENAPRFREILEAYEVLSDPERREVYNALREEKERREEREQESTRRGERAPGAARPARLDFEILLDPLEAIQGAVAPIGVPVFRTCPNCDGTRRVAPFPCPYCGQQGLIQETVTIRVRIPPLTWGHTVIDVPIHGLGGPNSHLRLHIRVVDGPGAAGL